MTTETKEFQIFRAGSYPEKGVTISIYDIQRTAEVYNPAVYLADLVLGHPSGQADPRYGSANSLQSYGKVLSLYTVGDALFAQAVVENSLVQMVRDGMYVDRSACFWRPDQPGNPVPGSFYLDHVGFLGRHPPGVMGMPPLMFSAPKSRNPLIADAEWRSLEAKGGLPRAINFSGGLSNNPLIRDAEQRALAQLKLRRN
jgi:hypothetical protein